MLSADVTTHIHMLANSVWTTTTVCLMKKQLDLMHISLVTLILFTLVTEITTNNDNVFCLTSLLYSVCI